MTPELPTEIHEIPGDTDPREALRQAAALIGFAEQFREVFYMYQLQGLRLARERCETVARSQRVDQL